MQESRRSPRRLCDGTFDTNNGAHQNGDQPQGFDLGWVGYVHSDGSARLVGFYVGNKSGANEPVRVNRVNFNLGHQINI